MEINQNNSLPKNFWNKKILNWEEGRYEPNATNQSWLERIANKSSRSLRARLSISGDIISKNAKGKHIVELGCGSSRLAEQLIGSGALSYRGIDIAENAIKAARERSTNLGLQDVVRHETSAILDLDSLKADIVFSLGLLDWLTPEEIKHIGAISGNARFLHAISERRPMLTQYLHRFYVYLAYAYKTGGYRPQYNTCEEIVIDYFKWPSMAGINIVREKELSFTTLITDLDV